MNKDNNNNNNNNNNNVDNSERHDLTRPQGQSTLRYEMKE
jgi:hypothetical protein